MRVKRRSRTTIAYQGQDRLFSDHWRLEVRPEDLNQPITVTLNDIACGENGGICAKDGGGARNTPSLTMGEDGSTLLTLSIADATGDEDDGQVVFRITFSRRPRTDTRIRLRTVSGGTATEGVDYWAHDNPDLLIARGRKTWDVGIPLIDDNIDDDGETVMVEISDARLYNEDNENPYPELSEST